MSNQFKILYFNKSIIEERKKKHECNYCSKIFSKQSALNAHILSHTGEKPHKCQIISCGRQFSILSNLRRHMKSHYKKNNKLSSTLSLSSSPLPLFSPLKRQILPSTFLPIMRHHTPLSNEPIAIATSSNDTTVHPYNGFFISSPYISAVTNHHHYPHHDNTNMIGLLSTMSYHSKPSPANSFLT
ncbi:hypothetical protein BJ944DRAFT_277933 [Cunninghamella echinulata]|nr:hypothetical protein BJ944DRAFT_277933 [Cunninghamella echinulata]